MEANAKLYLPPSPRYDQVRDVIVTGLLLGGGLLGYEEAEDALRVRVSGRRGRRRLPLPLLGGGGGMEVLEPRLEGRVVRYGRGDLRVYERLALDSRLEGFRTPMLDGVGLLVLDWRQLLYYTLGDLADTARRLYEVLRDAPGPGADVEPRTLGHAYALLAAARLRGLDKDLRIVLPGGADTGIIPSSTYRLLGYVDDECLEELEALALDAVKGVDVDVLEYIAEAVDRRDQYALRHMLRRMGCVIHADRLIAPADILE